MSRNDDDDDDLPFADLSHAWSWDCNNCGTENFQRSVSVNLKPTNDADREMIVKMYGEDALDDADDDPDQVTFAHSTPRHVVCIECGDVYRSSVNGRAITDGEEEDDDDDDD